MKSRNCLCKVPVVIIIALAVSVFDAPALHTAIRISWRTMTFPLSAHLPEIDMAR